LPEVREERFANWQRQWMEAHRIARKQRNGDSAMTKDYIPALGDIVASKRTGKVLGKVVHVYRDGVLMVFVKHDDGRSYRHQAMDLVKVAK